MERQPPYGGSNINLYAAQLAADTHTENRTTFWNESFSRKARFFSCSERAFIDAFKAEGQWQWDRDARRVSNPVSSNPYIEGQGGNAARTIYQGHMPNPNVKLENAGEPKLQYHEQDMEIGYEDKPAVLTYEGLEQKFMDEIIKLAKEQNDAEDAEHARHREKIMEINNQFQEKISTLRALQAKRREEFLLKEAQARLHQYQQAGMNHLAINQHPAAAEPHCGYATSQFDSYRDRTPFLGDGRNQQTKARVPTGQFDSYREGTPFLGDGRNQRTEARVPIPQGRVYNNARNY